MKWWRTYIYRKSLAYHGLNRTNHHLPKQWCHWVKKMNLDKYDTEYRRTRYGKTHLSGHNRLFRVNRYGEFQCSVPLEHFDRWSNSLGYTYPMIPKTFKEFQWVVTTMIEQTRDMT